MAKSKSGGKSGVAALDQSPSHLLHRALQRALDIYVEEFAVLAAADEREGATQADLVRITGIDRSTLADMARRMIGKGLLERERSNVDARANAVRLTEEGRLALADARPKMAQADAKLLKLIAGGGRRSAFVGLLRDLARTPDEAKPVKAAVKVEKKPKPAKTEKPAKAAKGGPKGGHKKAKKKAA